MTVIALDPGGTTGVAILMQRNHEAVEQCQVDTSTPEDRLRLADLLIRLAPIDVIMERFQFRYGGGRSRIDLTPVKVIGIVELHVVRNAHRTALWEQTPAQAKKLITDNKIRKLGLWVPGQPHAMDATRHLLYHLIVTRREKRWLDQLRPNE